jgi:hypothetical protein
MSVIFATSTKTLRLTATRDEVANGTLEILTAADAVIVVFDLDAAGGTVSGAVWTLVFDAVTVAATAAGVAAKAQIKTAGGVAKITGLTVGTSASDIIVNNTNIADSQNVTLTGAQTITHAT